MRIQINLASDPFRRDRPFIVASAALSAVLLMTMIMLAVLFFTERSGMLTAQRELDDLKRQSVRMDREQRSLEAQLKQPGNADVLERSQFLNALLYRKGISWTRLFADLEKVVPPSVRVVSVRPQVNARNHIYLDMVVASDTQKPVIDLLAKFEGSDVFGSTSVYGILPPSQTDPSFRYRLSVSYAQKL